MSVGRASAAMSLYDAVQLMSFFRVGERGLKAEVPDGEGVNGELSAASVAGKWRLDADPPFPATPQGRRTSPEKFVAGAAADPCLNPPRSGERCKGGRGQTHQMTVARQERLLIGAPSVGGANECMCHHVTGIEFSSASTVSASSALTRWGYQRRHMYVWSCPSAVGFLFDHTSPLTPLHLRLLPLFAA